MQDRHNNPNITNEPKKSDNSRHTSTLNLLDLPNNSVANDATKNVKVKNIRVEQSNQHQPDPITKGESAVDLVVTEEPLELQLMMPIDSTTITIATLMRTPLNDHDLLVGWLHAEGLWQANMQLTAHPENSNLWYLQTHPTDAPTVANSARLGVSSSACGICGTGSLEELANRLQSLATRRHHYSRSDSSHTAQSQPALSPALLASLPQRLQAQQPLFASTGGSHAAALFDQQGQLLVVREDVGRHNAVDKAIGWLLQQPTLQPDLQLAQPQAQQLILCVSSRAGFEVVQKAAMAGLGCVVAVGAASSLAVQCAQTFGVALYGFARGGRLCAYTS